MSIEELSRPEILSEAYVSSFNSSSLSEILNKSTTSFVLDKSCKESLDTPFTSDCEKALKQVNRNNKKNKFLLCIYTNIFNYYNNELNLRFYIII